MHRQRRSGRARPTLLLPPPIGILLMPGRGFLPAQPGARIVLEVQVFQPARKPRGSGSARHTTTAPVSLAQGRCPHRESRSKRPLVGRPSADLVALSRSTSRIVSGRCTPSAPTPAAPWSRHTPPPHRKTLRTRRVVYIAQGGRGVHLYLRHALRHTSADATPPAGGGCLQPSWRRCRRSSHTHNTRPDNKHHTKQTWMIVGCW